MKKSLLLFLASILLVLGLVVGCGNGEEEEQMTGNNGTSDEQPDEGETEDSLSGSITVLHHRTDINDTLFRDYRDAFNEKYPDVTVNFEVMTDYDGQVRTRMSTEDYGDVLMLPEVDAQEFELFFEPLGTVEEMEDEYLEITTSSYEGTVYGIPTALGFPGIVYNKRVFEDAGVTGLPGTHDEFIEAMQAIADNTDAIPYYTNFAAGWTMTQFESNVTVVAGDFEYYDVNRLHTEDIFAPGMPHYDTYRLLYDVAANDLIEADPYTTDWELSKTMMGNGEIGAMVLGNWAVPQMMEAAENPDDIGFMPYPTDADPTIIPIESDFTIGINRHSNNKEAARAWVDFFVHETDYATEAMGGVSPVRGEALPSLLEDLGVEVGNVVPTPVGEEGLIGDIDNLAEIGFWEPDFKLRIVEAAIGNRDESFDDIMNDLNERWNTARETVLD
ncbi:ABC-type glycerol-3-phosphate transport system substrate-binding protein [Natronobacillus azotifigens]|uniref:ABC transporter substrate-binding protein n=1 Tax=Natronobacillus azotifigens TaxID=472978 RepID=A0A9J6RC21_9BACI|nr:ABC transporter substrate-binding protein [Natronobacillus azotifigens]MCZ0703095.1 ABC transporter substrate-binding protein [Natronobacillus azotifigens]